MFQPLATVVMVPRERFSLSLASLESVLANTPPGTPLVYVDGNSPRKIARGIASSMGFDYCEASAISPPTPRGT